MNSSQNDGYFIHKQQLIAQLRAEMRRIGGKDYPIQFDRLGDVDLQALLNFVRDCETEQQRAVIRQRLQPWRR